MKYIIYGDCETNRGLARSTNQDNFYFNNKVIVDGTSQMCNDLSSYPVVAIFDGMGGEKNGDKASQIASSYLKENINNIKTKEDLNQFQIDVNKLVCNEFVKDKKRLGTTSAIFMLKKDNIYISNVGDSKILCCRKGVLQQLSIDHTETIGKQRKLTQHLGIMPSEMVIEPSNKAIKCNPEDIYILCSDGLTDMVSEEEIVAIIKSNNKTNISKALVKKAIDNGGKDNVTVITLKIKKSNSKYFVLGSILLTVLILIALFYFIIFKKSIEVGTVPIIKSDDKVELEIKIKGYRNYQIKTEDENVAYYNNGYIIGVNSGNTKLQIISNTGEILYESQIKVFPK